MKLIIMENSLQRSCINLNMVSTFGIDQRYNTMKVTFKDRQYIVLKYVDEISLQTDYDILKEELLSVERERHPCSTVEYKALKKKYENLKIHVQKITDEYRDKLKNKDE